MTATKKIENPCVFYTNSRKTLYTCFPEFIDFLNKNKILYRITSPNTNCAVVDQKYINYILIVFGDKFVPIGVNNIVGVKSFRML